MLAHSVYFRLVDTSSEAVDKFITACRRELTGHPGTVFFAVGRLAEDIAWEVSDRDFDVVLHLVFENKAAHDVYQESERHTRFIEQNEANWAQVRSCDAYVST